MFTMSFDNIGGKVNIFDTYSDSTAPSFNHSGDVYIMSFINIENVNYFKRFSFETSGTSEYRYLKTEYRVSKDSVSWTPWMILDALIDNFPPFDPKYKMYIDIKWTRIGDSNIGVVKLLNYNLYGSLHRFTLNDSSGNTDIIIPNPSPTSSTLFSDSTIPIVSVSTKVINGATGPQGAMGAMGATGPQGFRGHTGNDGAQGPQGIIGPRGVTGPQGPIGIGATGPQGEDGPQGPGSAVAGSQGQIQYNDNGNLGASSNLIFDGANIQLGNGGGLVLQNNSPIFFNGISDPLWHILRVPTYTNGILESTELQVLIPNTTEGFGVENSIGDALFQVRGDGSLSYLSSPLKIGQYTLPNIDGTSNQVLTTDGSGTVSWQNANGSGDRYYATSSSLLAIPSIGNTLEFSTQPNLSYTVGQIVLISTTFSESFYGDVDYTSDFDLIPSFQGEIEFYDSVSGTMSIITTFSKQVGLTFSNWILNLGNMPNIDFGLDIGSFSIYDTTITTTWSGSDIIIESLNSDIILKGSSLYWGSIIGEMPNSGSFSYGSSVTSDGSFIYTIGGDDDINYGLIVKTDLQGNIIWKKEIVDPTYGECIVVKNNNIFTLFTDNNNSGNILIVQLDTDANILNQWSFTGPTTLFGFDMDVDESNNVYFVGYQSDLITGNSDLVIGKLNTFINNIDWIYSVGINKDDFQGNGIKYFNNNIYVTGYDQNAGIIIKYDIDGTLLWSKYTDTSLQPYSITVDNNGYIYLCGRYGISTSFIMKLDNDGNVLWSNNFFIGVNNLITTSIEIDNSGNLYVLAIYSTRFFISSSLYYAKISTEDGSLIFQKELQLTGYVESVVYDNGHRNINYNNNTLYINGYININSGFGGDNMILISVPSDDIITGEFVNPISGNTWVIADVSYSMVTTSISTIDGPPIVSATLSSTTVSYSLQDSSIDGYELTLFSNFETVIEGNLNIGYNYVLPNIAGTFGQALIFPISGNILEWQTITASSGGGSFTTPSLDQVLSQGNTTAQSIIITSSNPNSMAIMTWNAFQLQDLDNTNIISSLQNNNFFMTNYSPLITTGFNYTGPYILNGDTISQGQISYPSNWYTDLSATFSVTWTLPTYGGTFAMISDVESILQGPQGPTGPNGLLATTDMYTIPFAPTFTYDNANGSLQQITLTGSAVMSFNGLSSGVFYFLEVTQDSSGSRTITWPTVTVAYGGGGVVPISTTPNATDRYIIFYNGTKYRVDYTLNYT